MRNRLARPFWERSSSGCGSPSRTDARISGKLKPEQRHRLWQAFLGGKLKRLRKPEPHRRQNISKLKP
jgi:hypothetical protein